VNFFIQRGGCCKLAGRLKSILLPCLLLLCFTLPHLDQGDFRRDTGRYAAVGLYMWQHGPMGVPYLNPDTPYFNKPPLAIAIHGFFLDLFGVHVAVARVPSILAALGVLIFSVLTVRLLASRVEALASGLVLAATYEFFRRTREISLDFWQLFFVMAAVYLIVKSLKQHRTAGLLLAGIPLGLALLCKPLVALGLLPVLVIWAILLEQPRAAIWLLAGTPFVALIVAAPWHLYMWSLFGRAFTNQYFGHEIISRASGELSTNPFWYYFPILLSGYWPWLLLVAWAIWQRWFRRGQPQRNKSRDLVLLGCIWVIWVLLTLSIFPDKKVNYALPLYPMLSWVAAAGLCRLPWRWLRTWYSRRLIGFAPAMAGVLVLFSLLPIQFQEPPSKDWQSILRWLHEQHISPANVSYYNLNENYVCYFYLKTGVFPQRFVPDEKLATNELLVLTSRPPKSDQSGALPAIFASGELAIVSSTNIVTLNP
jgi:4-amino-4-deoxy-L-arabinose transferase-like glycosyltransferase